MDSHARMGILFRFLQPDAHKQRLNKKQIAIRRYDEFKI